MSGQRKMTQDGEWRMEIETIRILPTSHNDPTIDIEDGRLHEILKEHGATLCPGCGRAIDRGDVAWNNASTEAGTPCCTVEIICQECDTSIAHVGSWWPGIDTFDDVLNVLDRYWE